MAAGPRCLLLLYYCSLGTTLQRASRTVEKWVGTSLQTRASKSNITGVYLLPSRGATALQLARKSAPQPQASILDQTDDGPNDNQQRTNNQVTVA